MDHGEKGRGRQRDFINKRLRQKNEAKAYIKNVGEEMYFETICSSLLNLSYQNSAIHQKARHICSLQISYR